MRMDRSDFNSKLATFKADVSLMTFDKQTFHFLKDKVYTEWTSVIQKAKDKDDVIEAMQKKNDRLKKKLN